MHKELQQFNHLIPGNKFMIDSAFESVPAQPYLTATILTVSSANSLAEPTKPKAS